MKIIYLVHQFYPAYYMGTEKFVLNLAASIRSIDDEVKVITYSFNDDTFYDHKMGNILFKNTSYNNIPILNIKYKESPDDLKYGLENEDLTRVALEILKSEMPDLIHVGHSMRVAPFIRAAILLGIPYIISLTDYFFVCPKYLMLDFNSVICNSSNEGSACHLCYDGISRSEFEQRYRVAREFLEEAKVVVAPSYFVKRVFESEFNNLKVLVVNHGIDHKRVKRNDKIYAENDVITMCYAGSLYKHKGLHIIIEALRQCKDIDVTLNVYGSGVNKEYNEYLNKAVDKDIRIRMCGVYSEETVGDVLSKTDVVIIPSVWNETYCFVLYEALACRVPVITAEAGALSENISHNLNSIVFPVGSISELTQIIQRIATAPQVLNELKSKINEMDIMRLEDEVKKYRDIYRSILT